MWCGVAEGGRESWPRWLGPVSRSGRERTPREPLKVPLGKRGGAEEDQKYGGKKNNIWYRDGIRSSDMRQKTNNMGYKKRNL